jgi:hypothetical protein
VRAILGHSTPEVNRRNYAHFTRKATAEQVTRASNLRTGRWRHLGVRPWRTDVVTTRDLFADAMAVAPALPSVVDRGEP